MSFYRGNSWKLDTADWTLESEDTFLLHSPARDAELQIDTYDFVSTEHWRVILTHASVRAGSSSQLKDVECGQFAGVTYDYLDEDGSYHCEWLLGYADLVALRDFDLCAKCRTRLSGGGHPNAVNIGGVSCLIRPSHS